MRSEITESKYWQLRLQTGSWRANRAEERENEEFRERSDRDRAAYFGLPESLFAG